jgi:hypothetical protein
LIVAAILGGTAVFSLIRMSTIVPDEAVYVVAAPGTATLEPGTYQLWIEL